jgi:hypothetical protein
MQVHDSCRTILDCCLGIDIERRRELTADLSHSGSAVTPILDVAGGGVQLMNEVGPTIEDHHLSIDNTNVDISPSLRVVRRRVHVPRFDAWAQSAYYCRRSSSRFFSSHSRSPR